MVLRIVHKEEEQESYCMNKDDNNQNLYRQFPNWLEWATHTDKFKFFEKKYDSYDFLMEYADVFNIYPARTEQPNPFSPKVMYIIDTLNKFDVKYTVDIFGYDGYKVFWSNTADSHKLVNIIVEPNPNATGPAIVFCAHHDVANPRSNNCQDNGASVCNLLKLTNLIKESKENLQRTIILFSDCEESGAKGAGKFAKDSTKTDNPNIIKHNKFGEISGVVNLELTGLGDVIWTDCHNNEQDITLHQKLEATKKEKLIKLSTPPSDVIAFRTSKFPALCIGILPKEDLKDRKTWRLCHSMEDTIEKCNRKNMEDFTNFLLDLTKIETTENQNTNKEHDTDNGANKTAGTMQT